MKIDRFEKKFITDFVSGESWDQVWGFDLLLFGNRYRFEINLWKRKL